ncbi:MAG: rhodanese-like domain-containing protein [Acidobacteriota bacterium]
MGDGHAAEELSFRQVQRRLAAGTVLPVNVLPREAFLARRIPGSVSLPLQTLPSDAPRVLPDRSAELLVYCTGFG